MLNIKNKGVTKTVIRSNGRSKTNKLKWEADYNGSVANISLDVEDDGNKSHYISQLTNEDLVALLNPQEPQMSLDERLLNDFENDTPQLVLQFETPKPKQTRKYIMVKKRPSTRRSSSRRSTSRRNSTRRNKKRSLYVRL